MLKLSHGHKWSCKTVWNKLFILRSSYLLIEKRQLIGITSNDLGWGFDPLFNARDSQLIEAVKIF